MHLPVSGLFGSACELELVVVACDLNVLTVFMLSAAPLVLICCCCCCCFRTCAAVCSGVVDADDELKLLRLLDVVLQYKKIRINVNTFRCTAA